jgi:hypothetical protein
VEHHEEQERATGILAFFVAKKIYACVSIQQNSSRNVEICIELGSTTKRQRFVTEGIVHHCALTLYGAGYVPLLVLLHAYRERE